MEKEIKDALEGKIEDLELDILEGAKIEGISLNQFNSGSSDMDVDEYYFYFIALIFY